ncbi:hypothetical protein LPJ73_001083 [Coemansia sp. RSA 2703]|nr:hypothetical protein LPJ73_001083 [Coemansia sp. RSA 2703]
MPSLTGKTPLSVAILLFVATVLTLYARTHTLSNSISSASTTEGTIIYDPGAPTFTLTTQALISSNIPFQNHSTPQPFQSYLQQTLNYTYFSDLFSAINATVGTLQTRGEAHVTVITPPEFDRVLKPSGVTIQDINEIALRNNIQKARLMPVCLGRFNGTLPNPNKAESDKGTFLLYSLVVADVYGDLVNIRREVFKLYRSKGGQGALFQPEGFWPHITIGFDRRDLFIEDGLYKGSNYCYAPIRTSK